MMGLNLKNEHLYTQVRTKSFSDKLTGVAKRYLSKKYMQKLGYYYNDVRNFSQSSMGVTNPFLLELKNYTLREITIRSIVDSLSSEALSILREEFTARVCKVEEENIQVVRIDNDSDKLAMMHADKLDILRASKSQLMTDEVFRFSNGKGFNADTTVAEYLNEFCLELMLEESDDQSKQARFVEEVRVLFMWFMKAYGGGIKLKYQVNNQSSLKGAVSALEVRNKVNVVSKSKIVRWVYKDSLRENDIR